MLALYICLSLCLSALSACLFLCLLVCFMRVGEIYLSFDAAAAASCCIYATYAAYSGIGVGEEEVPVKRECKKVCQLSPNPKEQVAWRQSSCQQSNLQQAVAMPA